MDGIMRGDARDPAKTTKAYLEWERGPVTNTPLSEMTGWVDTSLANGTWLVLVIHGVEGVGYQPLPTDKLRAYFDYIKEKSNRLWVATYQDGAKYIRERMKSTVTTRQVGAAINVTVTNAFDPHVYDVPLTARTAVPAQWTAVKITQGTMSARIDVQKGEQAQQGSTGAFVQYRIVPNASVLRIERAN